jgi:hypothetical protein
MSFFYTTDQVRNRTKTVTRRLGWAFLKGGETLNACVKCMGLKRGEKIERISQIHVLDARREPLNLMSIYPEYGNLEAALEGFPMMGGREFVKMFCRHMRCHWDEEVTRIEFKYLG